MNTRAIKLLPTLYECSILDVFFYLHFFLIFWAKFKYDTCVIIFMVTKSKKEYKWKSVKSFLKDLEKANKDPLFVKAAKDFIRYHTS